MNYEKLSKFIIAISWAGFIFMIIGIPLPPSPPYDGPKITTFYDKAIHTVIFGILAYLVIPIIKNEKRRDKISYLITFLILYFFIIFTEYYQAFVPEREPGYSDLIAGLTGIIIAIFYDYLMTHKPRPKLLLHICCIGCGAYVSKILKNNYKITLFFYNPNIFPKEEYAKRLEETERIAKKFGLKVIEGKYGHKKWLGMVKGHEKDEERGERCVLCYRDRLKATAKLAQEKGYRYFTTTLTISPHKNAKAVSLIGRELEKKYRDLRFLDQDFKKKEGFKESIKLSKALGLYRQDYCGCEFSKSYSRCDACK